MMQQPTIVLLKEGTDKSQGTPQLLANIQACEAIQDILKTTLGPRGMDKLINHGGQGMKQSATISNDGATIITLLDIIHPAAQTLVITIFLCVSVSVCVVVVVVIANSRFCFGGGGGGTQINNLSEFGCEVYSTVHVFELGDFYYFTL